MRQANDILTSAKQIAIQGSDGSNDQQSLNALASQVDQLINLVGELVITQAMLAQSAAQADPVEFERLHNGLTQLERNTRDMQESVMSIRMTDHAHTLLTDARARTGKSYSDLGEALVDRWGLGEHYPERPTAKRKSRARRRR